MRPQAHSIAYQSEIIYAMLAPKFHREAGGINGFAIELSANLVRRAMLHRAEGESYAPAGAFNQKHSIDHQGRFNSATPR